MMSLSGSQLLRKTQTIWHFFGCNVNGWCCKSVKCVSKSRKLSLASTTTRLPSIMQRANSQQSLVYESPPPLPHLTSCLLFRPGWGRCTRPGPRWREQSPATWRSWPTWSWRPTPGGTCPSSAPSSRWATGSWSFKFHNHGGHSPGWKCLLALSHLRHY